MKRKESLTNIEIVDQIDFSKKIYTFSKQNNLRKIIRNPPLSKMQKLKELGEITWVINYFYSEVQYCPTLLFVIMLLLNFLSKQETFYLIKLMIEFSSVTLSNIQKSLDWNKKYSIYEKDKTHSSRNLSWYFYFNKTDLFKISYEISKFVERKCGKNNSDQVSVFSSPSPTHSPPNSSTNKHPQKNNTSIF